MGEKKSFSIDRNGKVERTTVGATGQKHVDTEGKQGRNGHFKDEGQYRRAIEKAVKDNSRS